MAKFEVEYVSNDIQFENFIIVKTVPEFEEEQVMQYVFKVPEDFTVPKNEDDPQASYERELTNFLNLILLKDYDKYGTNVSVKFENGHRKISE